MPQVQFNLTKDQARVEVVLERASEEDKISYDELKQRFLESPFANHLPLEKGFQQALGKLLDTPPGEPTPATEVAQRTDAELRIVLSRNKFRASAEITQGHGGKKIRNMDVVVAARKAGVVQGLDTKAVGQLVAKAAEAAPGTVSREVIAEGREPVEGSDVRFEQLIPTLEDRATQPKEREDGSVDMKDYGKFLSVQEGQQLMRRHPAKPGQPGLSVLGKAIPCKAVKVGRMTPGTGTEISPDDPELLIATRSGIPRRLGHGFAQGMAVEQSLSLKAVNLASGHVEFEGT
ncbi:MAG: FapA family protein, partial [Gammaproteobacteria bacterium SHHR-1]